MKTFDSFRQDVYSQNGEDGVLAEILRRLNIEKGQFVEFGAWDGKFLSNTYSLLCKGWGGVYIESDIERFRDLEKTRQKFPSQLEIFNCFVNFAGENTLDEILSKSKTVIDFDVLSIDVDTYDWHIWESLKCYKPLLVVVEINSSVPPGVLQIHQPPSVIGSSFSSMLNLAKNKGYTLICHTGNMIFVRQEILSQLQLSQQEIDYPELLFDYSWVKEQPSEKSHATPSFFQRLITKLIPRK